MTCGEKMKKKTNPTASPAETGTLENELERVNIRSVRRERIKQTLYAMVVASAAAILTATLLLPVLRIYGGSMEPTLSEGDIVVALKRQTIQRGDIISFRYANRLLVKRVIGMPLDKVELDEDGCFTINGEPLDEPYLAEQAFGECDVEFPITVPEASYFVVGDKRSTSIDSRTSAVGFVSQEDVEGKIVFTVWPFDSFGRVG